MNADDPPDCEGIISALINGTTSLGTQTIPSQVCMARQDELHEATVNIGGAMLYCSVEAICVPVETSQKAPLGSRSSIKRFLGRRVLWPSNIQLISIEYVHLTDVHPMRLSVLDERRTGRRRTKRRRYRRCASGTSLYSTMYYKYCTTSSYLFGW
jgi:hypothetical protein